MYRQVSPETKTADEEFLVNEVYAVDVVVSSGEGKTKLMDEKETQARSSHNLILSYLILSYPVVDRCTSGRRTRSTT